MKGDRVVMLPSRVLLGLLTALVMPVTPAYSAASAPPTVSGLHGSGDDFYRYPSQRRLDHVPPGTLLAVEPMQVDERLRDSGSRAMRIMYRSVGLHGKPIAVTGFLLTPRRPTPRGGWPVVAWAHGTAGVGRNCAPSRTTNLYPDRTYGAYAEFAGRLLRDGYAVVGSDLPGLGFPGHLHSYMNSPSEARAVIDSVLAAHQVSAHLGRQWFAVGHSEGGAAALVTGETALWRARGLRFLGAVALAPGSHFAQAMAASRFFQPNAESAAGAAAYTAYWAVGAKTYAPDRIRYTDLLSPELARWIPQAKEQCLDQLGVRLYKALKKGKIHSIVNPDWARNHLLYRYITTAEPARHRSTRPILLLQGGKDLDVPSATTDELDADLCARGDVVEYRRYPQADHSGLLTSAYPELSHWLAARLRGERAENTC